MTNLKTSRITHVDTALQEMYLHAFVLQKFYIAIFCYTTIDGENDCFSSDISSSNCGENIQKEASVDKSPVSSIASTEEGDACTKSFTKVFQQYCSPRSVTMTYKDTQQPQLARNLFPMWMRSVSK